MTMVELIPREVTVGCDPFTGRPRSVRVGPAEVRVTAIERVRDETAAYPVNQGPRTVFVVRTTEARIRLFFRHRDRRWLMEGIDAQRDGLAPAA